MLLIDYRIKIDNIDLFKIDRIRYSFHFAIQFTKKNHLSLSKKKWIRKRIQNQIIFSRYIDDKNLIEIIWRNCTYIHTFVLLYVFFIFIIAARLSRYFQFRQIVRDASCNWMKLIVAIRQSSYSIGPQLTFHWKILLRRKGFLSAISINRMSKLSLVISFSDSLHIVTLQFTTAVSPLNRSWIIDQLRRLFI